MVSQTPLISIITPTLNSAATLEQTIQSVLTQDYPKIEYIVIDGGSTDETQNILRRHESRLSWSVRPAAGVADAFNDGISKATGEIIGIVNSDDHYEPGILKAVAATYAGTEGNFILHGQIQYGDEVHSRLLKPWPLPRLAMHLDLPFNHPSYFVSRRVYDVVGLYDTSYTIAMDFDFTVRAMQKGIQFRYTPQLMSHFRIGGLASSDPRKCHREVLRSQLAHGMNPVLCRSCFAAKMAINSAKKLFGRGAVSRAAAISAPITGHQGRGHG